MTSDIVPFKDVSEKIALRFLQTAVLVDDKAGYPGDEKPKADLNAPATGGLNVPSIPKMVHACPTTTGPQAGASQVVNTFDAKAVVDAFARNGIICAVVKPMGEDSVWNQVKELVRRSDVLIFDWEINGSKEKAVDVIDKLVKYELTIGNRLRLIIIYTEEPQIATIPGNIKKKLQESQGIEFIIDSSDPFSLSHDNITFVVLAKEHARVPPEYFHRRVAIKDLPERVVKEFCKSTSGLITNVMLESLSVLRDNTQMMITNIRPSLDYAYLSHRALLPNPDDAMVHAIDIVISEFHAVLDDNEVGKVTDFNAISSWLESNIGDANIQFSVTDGTKFTITKNELKDWLRSGISQSKWYGGLKEKDQNRVRNHSHAVLTGVFRKDADKGELLDCEFARITSLVSRYSNSEKKPYLRLGSVVKHYGDNFNQEYLLCIQPRCDSVRIEGPRTFHFLSLKMVDNEPFHIVVCDDGAEIKLRLNLSMFESKSFSFSPPNGSQDKVIRAVGCEDCMSFIADDGTVLKWIAELKTPQAQRIANNLAAKMCRVGLDESEWLRISAKE
jgi:hypothetical protein